METSKTSEPRDLNVWRELPMMADGYVPAVPRQWLFVGVRWGKQCRFECRLIKKANEAGTEYIATAVFAHNVHYLCSERVKLTELEPIN